MLQYLKERYLTQKVVVSQTLNNPEQTHGSTKIYDDFLSLKQNKSFQMFLDFVEDEIIKNHNYYAREYDVYHNKNIKNDRERARVLGRIEGYTIIYGLIDKFMGDYEKKMRTVDQENEQRKNIVQ